MPLTPLIFALFLKKIKNFPNIIRYNNLLFLTLRPGLEQKQKFFKLTLKYFIIKVMKRTTMKEYTTPTAEVCSVKVEKGFFVSQNTDLTYGGAGSAGTIENGGSYEL